MTTYIHQLKDWPGFRWDQKHIADLLALVSRNQGRLLGRMETLGFQLRAEAVLQTLTDDVIKSSEIEGEILDKEQVRSSVARRLGFDVGGLKQVDRNVEGVVEMMLDATQNYDKRLTKSRLFAWHSSLFPTGRSGMGKITVGGWRTDTTGAMQVISGPIGRERVHYEAPAADLVPAEMDVFLTWFNAKAYIDPLLKAALAHLWFVTIHPFEDGNGRIARAIADMALAQSEQSSQRFYSMSAQIRADRKAYYNLLESTQKGDLDVTGWLQWFLACLDRAIGGADSTLADVLQKGRFWERYAGQTFNDRQRLMLNRLLDGFEGKLTSSKWAAIAKCSQDTASRDIDDLVKRSILVRDAGGGRSTSYMLVVTVADPLRAAAAYTRENVGFSVWDGPKLPTNEERKERRDAILQIADKIDALAETSRREPITHQQFEAFLTALREHNFFVDGNLVSAVAFAIHRDGDASPLLGSAR